MAKHKLKVLLNIGTAHQQQYGIPESPNWEGVPPQEGDIISVDEDMANILVNVLKVAKEYDAKEEKAHEEDVRAAAVAAVTPDVAANLAKEQAEKEAAKQLKGK